MVVATPSSTRQQQDRKGRAAEEEEERWRSVEDTDNAEDLRAYLKAYPKGKFSALALGKLALMDQPRPIPPVLRWSNSAASGKFLRDKADQVDEDRSAWKGSAQRRAAATDCSWLRYQDNWAFRQ